MQESSQHSSDVATPARCACGRACIVLLIMVLCLALCGFKWPWQKSYEETFTWPDSELVSQLPVPASAEEDTVTGYIEKENDSTFICWVVVSSTSDLDSYINDCKESGFTVSHERTTYTYSAQNEAGYRLSVSYYDKKSTEAGVPMISIKLKTPAVDPVATVEEEADGFPVVAVIVITLVAIVLVLVVFHIAKWFFRRRDEREDTRAARDERKARQTEQVLKQPLHKYDNDLDDLEKKYAGKRARRSRAYVVEDADYEDE